ncbi:MAG: aminopeptidase P family protein [Phycisphaerales bacterium]|nr:MAG: aminopeptidase P family protein [Phycisphaerales bacterium]
MSTSPTGSAGEHQPDERQARTERLRHVRDALASVEADAILVQNAKDIRYLTGCSGHDCLLLLTGSDAVLISDPRYDEQLNPWRGGETEVVIGTRHRLPEAVAQACRERAVSSLGLQAEYMTLLGHQQLKAALDGVRLVETTGLIAPFRMRKDVLEVARIERGVQIQQAALEAAFSELTRGMTEREFCARIEYEMKIRGAEKASFDPIVATGANSSRIHHETSDTPIGEGTLLIDWGAVVEGYSSDMTRTFAVGDMPERVREIYAIVLEAQLAAIEACRPGRTCAEIDAVARDLITEAGYGKQFGHGLGHGLGMDTHEGPYFNNLQTDVVLEAGMVMTVEPGIYLPGLGGVRIEDDVVITESGCRVLGDWPKDMEAMRRDVPGRSMGVVGERL